MISQQRDETPNKQYPLTDTRSKEVFGQIGSIMLARNDKRDRNNKDMLKHSGMHVTL